MRRTAQRPILYHENYPMDLPISSQRHSGCTRRAAVHPPSIPNPLHI